MGIAGLNREKRTEVKWHPPKEGLSRSYGTPEHGERARGIGSWVILFAPPPSRRMDQERTAME